jgi:predicted ATPase
MVDHNSQTRSAVTLLQRSYTTTAVSGIEININSMLPKWAEEVYDRWKKQGL